MQHQRRHPTRGTRHAPTPGAAASSPATQPAAGGWPVGGVVPVLAATGGTGRSTLASLLAQHLATGQRCLLVDAGRPAASPWGRWPDHPAISRLPVDPARWDAAHLYAACAKLRGRGDTPVHVLTTATTATQDGGGAASLSLADCQRVLATVTFAATVVDPDTPLLAHTATPDASADEAGAGWLRLAGAAPVLCVPSSAKGIHDATTLITCWETVGLPVSRVVVAVNGIAATPLPRRVLAGLTLLQPRVAGIVRVPHEPRLRAVDSPRLDWTGRSLRHAVADLATALATAAAASTTAASSAPPPLQPAAITPSPLAVDPASGVGGRADSPVVPSVSSSASSRSTGRTPC